MNKEELNELTLEELKYKLEDDVEALKNLRFQKAMQQLENPRRIKEIKKEIAQLKTVIHEYKLGIRK
ncbi:MAG: 50S ribosomal protein L29 [Candidatus Marinimicrobia bacterium]|nr:50S ribosomal protein L29 [Candidatus Neomarinimicrobiota bacterium]